VFRNFPFYRIHVKAIIGTIRRPTRGGEIGFIGLYGLADRNLQLFRQHVAVVSRNQPRKRDPACRALAYLGTRCRAGGAVYWRPFGSRPERYSAREVQSFSGIAAVTERSGKKKWVHFRWAARPFTNGWTLHRPVELGARAYYQRQRNQGKRHHAALRHWLSNGFASYSAAERMD